MNEQRNAGGLGFDLVRRVGHELRWNVGCWKRPTDVRLYGGASSYGGARLSFHEEFRCRGGTYSAATEEVREAP